MQLTLRAASVALAVAAIGVSISAQALLLDVMSRHGIQLPGGSFERAFDEGMTPSIPVSPGSFATPLAMIGSATGSDRVAAAYAFAILAGRAGHAASAQELNAAGAALVQMLGSDDRRSRVAAARVSGRLFALPFDARAPRVLPPGLVEELFVLLNREQEIDQLAAMDALGLLRQASAVAALSERYYFYRDNNRRALAGGALEALGRIGGDYPQQIVKLAAADPWSEGNDATALAVAFARERLLQDGSVAIIRRALDDRARRNQARGYLAELGVPVP